MGRSETMPAALEPISFVDHKRRLERERTISQNPQLYAAHFLDWALEKTKPEEDASHGHLPSINNFEASFNNGQVQGRFLYQRVRKGEESARESLQFQELGGRNRTLAMTSSETELTLYAFYASSSDQDFYMNADEIAKFLSELGAPRLRHHPFPFATIESEIPTEESTA